MASTRKAVLFGTLGVAAVGTLLALWLLRPTEPPEVDRAAAAAAELVQRDAAARAAAGTPVEEPQGATGRVTITPPGR